MFKSTPVTCFLIADGELLCVTVGMRLVDAGEVTLLQSGSFDGGKAAVRSRDKPMGMGKEDGTKKSRRRKEELLERSWGKAR